MEKIWVKDVKEGEKVKSLFLVARKAIPTAKSGKTYLAATFQDKTGELEARAFERIEEFAPQFEEKDYVEVEGQVGVFQGRPQLRIEGIAKVDAGGVDAAEFIFVPPPEPKKPEKSGFSEAEEALWKELHGLVAAVADTHVKTLVTAFLEDEDVAHRLRRAPAAKTIHHAYPGGLLEHTVSCLKLAHRLADQYPQVDRDLLVAGAFFHDLGKIRELSYDRQVEYTDEGRLVGHLVMTAQWIHDKARRVGVPRDLEQHIVHLVLSHHGRLEYGSPKAPMTLEALLTHFIDDLDSRVNSWLNLMGREGGTRRWTDSSNIYEHHIWRGSLPTAQVEKKGPPPELLTPVIYVPHDGQPHPGGEQRSKKKKRSERGQGHRPEGAQARGPQKAEAVAGAGEAVAAEAPKAEGTPRPERPQRPERHDRGGGPGGAPFGGGRPGDRDRTKRYMGPRLPGDKGPQARPKKEGGALTHNPFAALAQKIEEPAKPEEHVAAPDAPDAGAEPTAPAETPAQGAPANEPSSQ